MQRLLARNLAFFIVLQCAFDVNASEAPKLSYIDEFTNTKDVRDIALFGDKIWAATGGGISVHDRKDGHFLFKLTSIHGLFGNSVNRLQQTGRGTLTAAGDFGITEISPNCTVPSKECFVSVHVFASKVFDPVKDIIATDDGTVFLGHQSGLYGFDPKRDRPIFNAKGMWSAAASGPNGILIGGMDGRLMQKARGASSFQRSLLLTKPVLDIAPIRDGFLVADGSSLVKLEDGHIKPVLEGSRVATACALFANDDETIVGASNGLLFEYRKEALFRIADVKARITALFADDDAIWVGVAEQGLFRVDRKSKTVSNPLMPEKEICSNHITRITKFKDLLIAASFDGGACALRDGRWKPIDGLGSPYVHGVASDGKVLWVATSLGLARFDENLVNVPIDDNDPKEIQWFKNSAAVALAETPSGFVVGAPWGAVNVKRRGDGYTARFISHFQGAPEHMTALVSADDGVLISSETEGVRWVGKNRKLNRTYLDPVHLPEAWILDVSSAGGDAFWAASCQNGVAYVDSDNAVKINAKQGLTDDRTVGIAAFDNGAFVATLDGLSFAEKAGIAVTPFKRPLPDPRGSMVAVFGNRLYLGTESGLALFKIVDVKSE